MKKRNFHRTMLDERDRTMSIISSEIHDNINQLINLGRMNIHWLYDYAHKQNKAQIGALGLLLDRLLLDTNNFAHMLNSGYLENIGLLAAVKEQLLWVKESKQIKYQLKITGKIKKMNSKIELMIFRIFQEAVNNCIVHSKAKSVSIDINYSEISFSLKISDDGKCFKVLDEDSVQGINFKNMLNRAQVLNGSLTISSSSLDSNNVIFTINNEAFLNLKHFDNLKSKDSRSLK